MHSPSAAGSVVSNTTPLIALTGVGLLDLLPTLYGQIVIPEAVFDEYQVGRQRYPNTPDLASLNWILVQHAPYNPAIPIALDAGEAEAIALALALHARIVLLDEKRGRRVAQRLHVTIAGSLTVLLEAKSQGSIPAVAPIVDQMIAQGRRISPTLRQHILSLGVNSCIDLKSASTKCSRLSADVPSIAAL